MRWLMWRTVGTTDADSDTRNIQERILVYGRDDCAGWGAQFRVCVCLPKRIIGHQVRDIEEQAGTTISLYCLNRRLRFDSLV